MAFDDQPRSTRSTSTRRVPAGGRSADPQTVLVRRAVAGGLGLLIILLLVFAIDGWLDSRRENALKDYNREVAALVQSSDREVGRPFFELLAAGGRSPVELESAINQLRVTAERQLARAEDLDVPDDLQFAQRHLLTTLSLRAGALEQVAGRVRTALAGEQSEEAGQALEAIAGQMQALLASDVVFSQRVIPYIQREFDEQEIGGQTIQTTRFLPNLAWLNPETVRDRLGAEASVDGAKDTGPVAPGLHGHGIESVSVAGQTLEPGQTNRVPAGSNLVFDVKFANQGENDENDVVVRVRITGSGKPITVTKRIEQTKAGQSATVAIPLAQAPPIGTPVKVQATVEPVRGEKKTDNNTVSFPTIFTR